MRKVIGLVIFTLIFFANINFINAAGSVTFKIEAPSSIMPTILGRKFMDTIAVKIKSIDGISGIKFVFLKILLTNKTYVCIIYIIGGNIYE